MDGGQPTDTLNKSPRDLRPVIDRSLELDSLSTAAVDFYISCSCQGRIIITHNIAPGVTIPGGGRALAEKDSFLAADDTE